MQFNLLEKKKVLFLNSYVYYRWEKKKWKKKGINLDLFFPQKDIESDDGWGESGETATAETVRNCRSCRRSKRVDQNLQVLKWSRVAILYLYLYLYIGAEWCHCLTKSFCLGLASVSDLCSLIWSASRPRVLLYCLEDMKFRKIHVSHDRLFWQNITKFRVYLCYRHCFKLFKLHLEGGNEIKKNISKIFFTYSCLEVLTEGMKNSFSYLVI